MRITTLLLATAALVAATGANAAALVPASFTYQPGVGGLQGGETLFASFSPGSLGGVSGSGYVVQTGSNGIGADPAVGGQGDPYLTVPGGASANFSFAGGIGSLGLDYGSADDYNTFTVTYANGDFSTLTGTQVLLSPPANGDQTAARTNGRLTFSALGGNNNITGLSLTSSGNSLEVDNLGVRGAVPEPATWAMMLIGFGAAGVSLRRRRTAGTVMQAA